MDEKEEKKREKAIAFIHYFFSLAGEKEHTWQLIYQNSLKIYWFVNQCLKHHTFSSQEYIYLYKFLLASTYN